MITYEDYMEVQILRRQGCSLLKIATETGMAVTSLAFLGVNMFLSGLHSYGEL